MNSTQIGVISALLGILAIIVVGSMKVGAAEEKILQLEQDVELNNAKFEKVVEDLRVQQRILIEQSGRIDERTKVMETGQSRIEDLIRSIR